TASRQRTTCNWGRVRAWSRNCRARGKRPPRHSSTCGDVDEKSNYYLRLGKRWRTMARLWNDQGDCDGVNSELRWCVGIGCARIVVPASNCGGAGPFKKDTYLQDHWRNDDRGGCLSCRRHAKQTGGRLAARRGVDRREAQRRSQAVAGPLPL